MKKFIIIAFAILITGFVSSCAKDNSVKPAVKATTKIAGDRGTTGSADGSPPAASDSPDNGTTGSADGSPPQ